MRAKAVKIHSKPTIESYEFSNNPSILVMAGMHGDEKTGVILLNKLFSVLQRQSKNHRLAIIPALNPEAIAANTRTNPRDGLDLNRLFPIKKKNKPSLQIAGSIQNYAKKFKIIIDLHVFPKQMTLVCGVDPLGGGVEIQKRVSKLMSALPLEAICRIDDTSEPRKSGSLCAYLQSLDKLAFGIELPPHEVLTKSQFNNMVNSLINLAKSYPSLNFRRVRKLRTFIRMKQFAPMKGTFRPLVKAGQKVDRGRKLGSISGTAVRPLAIRANAAGTIISISYPQRVKRGERILVIGKAIR